MNMPSTHSLFYFSYGMNCSPEVMKYHYLCIPIGAAILPGYHLTFHRHANIEPGGIVKGVLWKIDQQTLDELDQREGYPSYYDRKMVTVQVARNRYEAIVYFMTDESVEWSRSLLPNDSYVQELIFGYQTFAIPLDQIKIALQNAKRKSHEIT